MLGRMVVKLLFKACVPLVAVAGVMSYGVYLRGGDPAGMWKHVASGAFGQIGSTLSKAKTDVAGMAGSLANNTGLQSAGAGRDTTTVFTWKDANGTTHFGTSAPGDVAASTLTVDPNVNVLVPVSAPPPVEQEFQERFGTHDTGVVPQLDPTSSGQGRAGQQSARASSGSSSVQKLESEIGGPLPGIAGQILSSGGSGSNGADPGQLIRLLQSVGK